MTLLGAAHSLAADPESPQAHRLAESAARNASLLARMVLDLQQIARRAVTPPRREMIEVVQALRDAIPSGNVRIDGDESLIAIAAPADLATFAGTIVAAARGKTVTIAARADGDAVRVTIRTAFPDRAIDVGLIQSLAEPLGAVSIGVDGSVTLTLPRLRVGVAIAGSRWQPSA